MANFQEMIQSETPVLVDFYADWCQPCKMMAPILEDLAGRMGESARILKVNVDKNPQASQAYGIRSIPTMILFKKGQPVWRNSGVMGASDLEQIIRRYA